MLQRRKGSLTTLNYTSCDTVCILQVLFAVFDFVSDNLGPQFVESPPVKLSTLYEDTSNTIPLVFVLSPGSDPMSAFLRFAKEMNYMEK